MKNIIKIKGLIKHYDWGGHHFLPDLLHVPNLQAQPFAEYWLSALPYASAKITPENIDLEAFIHQNPMQALGKTVAEQFGQLPFLLKILDVAQMLSIQTHPTREQAQKGYLRENENGIPPHAPHRNYKDQNHKPEILVALSDFWLLHGFRPLEVIEQTFRNIAAFAPLLPFLDAKNLRFLYQKIMELPQNEADMILQNLLTDIIPLYQSEQLDRTSPHFWAAKAALTLPNGKHDRGIFSIYMLNIAFVPKGKGIFQPAGILHSYLEGQNVELMANSDNVLRGGLTTKHIDVPELLENTIFEPFAPQILDGVAVGTYEKSFPTPANDFLLSVIELPAQMVVEQDITNSPRILICLEGEGTVQSETEIIKIKRGEAIWVSALVPICLSATEPLTLYQASVPPAH